MQPLDPALQAAILASVGFVFGEVVMIYRSMKTRGPDRLSKHVQSRFYWIVCGLIAVFDFVVAFILHDQARPAAWFVFGIGSPAIVAQIVRTPLKLLAPDPPSGSLPRSDPLTPP